MNMDVLHPDPHAQAADWFARLLAPDCTPAQRAEFERWRQQPAHAQAYEEVVQLWGVLEAPEAQQHAGLQAQAAWALGPVAGRSGLPSDWQHTLAGLPAASRASARWVRAPRRQRWMTLAATAAVASAMVWSAAHWLPRLQPRPAVYATTDAGRQVTLDDGSELQLDRNTRLTVQYTRSRRNVQLQQGRAVFQVSRQPLRPFTVDLGESEVEVLGTRFQAVREAEGVSVTLEQGSLALSRRHGDDVRRERLSPGEQIRYATATPGEWQRRPVDTDAATAWTRGRLVFRGTPLGEAIAQANRYASVYTLHLHDSALAALPVSGSYMAGDTGLMAQAWAATLPVCVQPRGQQLQIRAKCDD